MLVCLVLLVHRNRLNTFSVYNSVMSLPQDDFILLSVVNTKLRDEYSSLEELCSCEGVSLNEICGRLNALGYEYAPEYNAFKHV